MDSDQERGDLASNQVGGGTANQYRGRGGLALESRESGAKILQSNQRSFLLVDGACCDWTNRGCVCAPFMKSV